MSEEGGWLERCWQSEPREIGDALNDKKTTTGSNVWHKHLSPPTDVMNSEAASIL